MSIVVHGIDVGFGNTKYVVSHPPAGEIACGLFPSLAPLSATLDMSGGVLAKRNTVTVEVEGNKYEVGPDVGLALGTHPSRVLHSNYCESAEYLALFRGALSYIGAPEIDLAVVGLPVSQLAAKSATLKQRLEGHHPVADGKSVNVRRILTFAQPLGGFIHYALTHGLYRQMRDQCNLVIDPGFYTVDWVLSKGIQPLPRRCGTFQGGMYALLRRLAQAISENLRIDFDDLTALDAGLRAGTFHLFGERVPLERYAESTRPVVQDAVHAIANRVGDGRDVDSIVLVGGGAQALREAIARQFPSHSILIAPESVFANVRGFQLGGEELMHRHRAEVA